MMDLTPERRVALRREAELHRQEQLAKARLKDTLNPAFVPAHEPKEKMSENQTEHHASALSSHKVKPSLQNHCFLNQIPNSKETPDLSPQLYPHAGNAPARRVAGS